MSFAFWFGFGLWFGLRLFLGLRLFFLCFCLFGNLPLILRMQKVALVAFCAFSLQEMNALRRMPEITSIPTWAHAAVFQVIPAR